MGNLSQQFIQHVLDNHFNTIDPLYQPIQQKSQIIPNGFSKPLTNDHPKIPIHRGLQYQRQISIHVMIIQTPYLNSSKNLHVSSFGLFAPFVPFSSSFPLLRCTWNMLCFSQKRLN